MSEHPRAACVRCGVIRTVKPDRHQPLCRDCIQVLPPEQRKTWAA